MLAIFPSPAGLSLTNSPWPGIDGKFTTGFNNGGGHSFLELYTGQGDTGLKNLPPVSATNATNLPP
jgi:hypothetical protein